MKKFIKFLFKGLVNNEEVIYESKKHPWWSAAIILILSIVVAIIPSFVSIAKIKGSEVLTSSQNASLDTSLVLFSQYLEENNIKLEINGEGRLDVNAAKQAGLEEHVITAQEKELLVVRVCEDKDATNYAKMYADGKTSLDDTLKETPRSYLIFTESNVYLTTYLKTAEVKNTIENGTIKEQAKAHYTFIGLNESAKGTEINSFYASKDIDSCITHWEEFFVDLYKVSKTQYLWGYTGVLCAINLGVVALVALLTMILTRLKSATGDKLNYLQALQITCFASFAPALISVLLGFMIPSFAQVGFVLCLGLRSTFLGMKAANPARN